MKTILIAISFLCSLPVFSQQDISKTLKESDEYYRKQQYAQAAAGYAKVAAAEPTNGKAKFNEANALFRQDKKVEAVQLFADITNTSADKNMLSKAWYNKGVILTNQKNLEESIEAYKNALRNDPSDKEARENLQKALLELKQKQENKKQDQQQKKQKEQPEQNKSKMQPREAEQRLRLLQQKEKQVQERVQKEKTKTGAGQAKDW
jgi:tetratricopeptide (TPR) repeat protein